MGLRWFDEEDETRADTGYEDTIVDISTIKRWPLAGRFPRATIGIDDMKTQPIARRIETCPCCDEPREGERFCRYCGTDIDERVAR